MNRRGFITSALKATAAGILVPEHLWGRSMVAGFGPRITVGVDLALAKSDVSVFVHHLTAEHLNRVSIKALDEYFKMAKVRTKHLSLRQGRGHL